MPTHIRARCSWQIGTMLPKDQVVINPTFRRQLDVSDPTSGVDAQALADDLAAALNTWVNSTFKPQLTVKLYDVQAPKPSFPLAEKVLNVGVAPSPDIPPELAITLSFYGDRNIPRRRGRLYIPALLLGSSTVGANVDIAKRQKVAALVPIFAGLGGANVDWGVWSTRDLAFHKAEHWWVDDEWDVQRRRGNRPTLRDQGTTGG